MVISIENNIKLLLDLSPLHVPDFLFQLFSDHAAIGLSLRMTPTYKHAVITLADNSFNCMLCGRLTSNLE